MSESFQLQVQPGLRPAPVLATAASAKASEFLTFRLGAEHYGIDILAVQEIRSYEAPTRIANARDFIKGVMNLRGVIVPIIDLRLRFGQLDAGFTEFTVVVVLNVGGRVVGMVVDAVSDVLELPAESIRPAPALSAAAVDTSFITGIATHGEQLLVLLDIEALMNSPELGLADMQAQLS